MKKFVITVKFRSRTHQYKVVPQIVNKDEELFSVVANSRTILIRSTLKLICSNGGKICWRGYSYNEEELTNKCLMKKVIEAIDNSMALNVAHLKVQNAIAV